MSEENSKKEIILIDDDELIHFAWRKEATKKNLILHSFESIDSFLAQKDKFDLDTVVYVDSDLGNGIIGEREAVRIFQAGFKNIYLATGYSPSDVDLTGITWIKQVVGKRPQF